MRGRALGPPNTTCESGRLRFHCRATSTKVAIELMESYKLGVNSYVIKPEDPVKFAELIAEISRYWLTINEAPPA